MPDEPFATAACAACGGGPEASPHQDTTARTWHHYFPKATTTTTAARCGQHGAPLLSVRRLRGLIAVMDWPESSVVTHGCEHLLRIVRGDE